MEDNALCLADNCVYLVAYFVVDFDAMDLDPATVPDWVDLAIVEVLVPSVVFQVPLVVYPAIVVAVVVDFVAIVDVLIPFALANAFDLPAAFHALLCDVFQNLLGTVQAVVEVEAVDVDSTAVAFAPFALAIVFDHLLDVVPYLFDNFLVVPVKVQPVEHFVVAVASTAVDAAHFVLAIASEMLDGAVPYP